MRDKTAAWLRENPNRTIQVRFTGTLFDCVFIEANGNLAGSAADNTIEAAMLSAAVKQFAPSAIVSQRVRGGY